MLDASLESLDEDGLSSNSKSTQNSANCLSVFDHFLGLALKGLKLVRDLQKGMINRKRII